MLHPLLCTARADGAPAQTKREGADPGEGHDSEGHEMDAAALKLYAALAAPGARVRLAGTWAASSSDTTPPRLLVRGARCWPLQPALRPVTSPPPNY